MSTADAPGCRATRPVSLMRLLTSSAPLFTAPSFRTFCGLACGFFAQTGKRTVCGMLGALVTIAIDDAYLTNGIADLVLSVKLTSPSRLP